MLKQVQHDGVNVTLNLFQGLLCTFFYFTDRNFLLIMKNLRSISISGGFFNKDSSQP